MWLCREEDWGEGWTERWRDGDREGGIEIRKEGYIVRWKDKRFKCS